MRAVIRRSEARGTVSAPPSKSYTIRALMCAALARGESRIVSPLISDDTRAAVNVLRQVWVGVSETEDGWQVSGGSLHPPSGELFCGESAATLRFMTAICSLVRGECRLTAGPSLSRRPIRPLLLALKQLGVDCSSHGGFPPVTVSGGKPGGNVVELPGDISSQFVSALLLMAPVFGLTIKVTTPLESRPYVPMTLDCMRRFGVTVSASEDLKWLRATQQQYQPARFRVEGDWSSASYLLAMGAVAGEVTVDNINTGSLQGDRVILDLLGSMGASVETGLSSVTARKSMLKPIHADLSDCIDLLPTMAVLAAAARGVSELSGTRRGRIKESDRVSAVTEGLRKMGVTVGEEENRLVITGSKPGGAVIDPRGDHRIAMAFGILGLLTEKTVIEGAECVSKTFPDFWDVLRSLGSEVELHE